MLVLCDVTSFLHSLAFPSHMLSDPSKAAIFSCIEKRPDSTPTLKTFISREGPTYIQNKMKICMTSFISCTYFNSKRCREVRLHVVTLVGFLREGFPCWWGRNWIGLERNSVVTDLFLAQVQGIMLNHFTHWICSLYICWIGSVVLIEFIMNPGWVWKTFFQMQTIEESGLLCTLWMQMMCECLWENKYAAKSYLSNGLLQSQLVCRP